MRIVSHPNIVELKAFYYSNGERVSGLAGWFDDLELDMLTVSDLERRGILKLSPRVCTGNCLPRLSVLQQNEGRYANTGD